MFTLTPISLVLFGTTFLNLVAFGISWQRRKNRTGLYFALGLLGVAFWTLAAGLDYAAVPIPLKVFFAKLEYTGYNTSFFFFVLFVLSYAGYEDWLANPRARALFALLPASNILLAWTNDLHGLLWSGFVRSDVGQNTVIFQHGPAFTWAVITGYLMIAMIILPLWQASRSAAPLARRQARLLFFASLMPIIGNLLYLIQTPEFRGVDWTSILFSISGLLFVLALYGTRLLDLAPIAREKLVNSLSDGMLVLDQENRITDANAAAADMIDAKLSTLIGSRLPDDLPQLHAVLGVAPEQEARVELAAGGRYFDVLISPLQDRRRVVIGRLLILRDITRRKVNELQLLQLTQAVEQSPASIVITDFKGNITYVNPQFSVLTGYSQEEAIGKNPNILQSGQTPDAVYKDMWRTILSGQTWRGQFLNKTKGGDLYWEQAVIAPVMDSRGQLLNFIAVKENITERKNAEDALQNANHQLEYQLREIQKLQNALREQAIRDPLTGLHNRRFLGETLEHEFHAAARMGTPLTILLLDIDHFKEINDSFGHRTGDTCLVTMAELLRRHTRKSDLVCRYGGDEFLLVLPDTRSEQAVVLAEDLRTKTEEELKMIEGNPTHGTLSIGLASYPVHGEDSREVIDRADRALYLSKESGRNRVTIWSESVHRISGN